MSILEFGMTGLLGLPHWVEQDADFILPTDLDAFSLFNLTAFSNSPYTGRDILPLGADLEPRMTMLMLG